MSGEGRENAHAAEEAADVAIESEFVSVERGLTAMIRAVQGGAIDAHREMRGEVRELRQALARTRDLVILVGLVAAGGWFLAIGLAVFR